MPACYCGRSFYVEYSLYQHQRDTRHAYCRPCDLYFSTVKEAEDHRLALHNWTCETCDSVFATNNALKDHQRAKGHYHHCRDCNRSFGSQNALRQHLDSPAHVGLFRCCDCDRDFVSERALEQHLTDKVHEDISARQSLPEFYCAECQREFVTETALQQHKSSLKHKPLSKIRCIGRKCGASFTSPSAFLHHLESGACSSGISRAKLNSLLLEHDQDLLISNSREILNIEFAKRAETKLHEDDCCQHSDSESQCSTPRTGRTSSTNWEMIPTPSNGSTSGIDAPSRRLSINSTASSWALVTSTSSPEETSLADTTRCPLCPPYRPPFHSYRALRQHMDSVAHSPPLFHCPISLFPNSSDGKRATKKSFTTLSGLAQHLESGACHGGITTLKRTVKYVESKLAEIGWNGSLLLNF